MSTRVSSTSAYRLVLEDWKYWRCDAHHWEIVACIATSPCRPRRFSPRSARIRRAASIW